MTSEARERSWDAGKPIALFRFTRGNVSWFYTSSDRPEIHNGDTYEPAPIWRTAIKQGSERAKLSIKVTLPSTLPVASNWRPYPPSDPVVLTIFCRHVGETDALAEWIGRVVAPNFNGATLELTGEPSSTGNRRAGNLGAWQRGCGLVLYSQGLGMCNLNPEIVSLSAELAVVDGANLTAPEFAIASRSLVGGQMEWFGEGEELHQIAITGHVGSVITVASGSAEFVPALAVTAYTRPLYMVATLTSIAGLTLTAAEFATLAGGRLAGGFIKWTRASDGLIEFRSIKSHAGDSITLDFGSQDLGIDVQVLAYPGCAHTWAYCGYHQNQPNYGGDLWMPVKTPFDGNPVW